MVSCKFSSCGVGTHATAESANTTVKAKCLKCPEGTYSGSTGLANASQCSRCPAGRWGNLRGATTLDDCTICRGGTFSNVSGATAPKCSGLCVPGTYSLDGMKACLSCGKGRFQSASNRSTCVLCPLKKTTLREGGTSCVCEAKYYEDKAGNCTVCPEDITANEMTQNRRHIMGIDSGVRNPRPHNGPWLYPESARHPRIKPRMRPHSGRHYIEVLILASILGFHSGYHSGSCAFLV